MAKITSLKTLIKKHQELEKDIQDAEANLRIIRNQKSGDWESGIKNDERKSVQTLYNFLMNLRAERCCLELSQIAVLSNEEVKCLNIGRSIHVEVVGDEL